MRALRSWPIDSAHIASGFFSDVPSKLEATARDFAIDEDMEGKSVYLYGGYDDDAKTSMRALRGALTQRGVKAFAFELPEPGRGELPMKWHAKVAIFESDDRPVLAIVGSSNFTGPTMHGSTERGAFTAPKFLHVEADTFYWLRNSGYADQAVIDAFHYWGQGRLAPHISFFHEQYDDEIEKLMTSLRSDLRSFRWRPV